MTSLSLSRPIALLTIGLLTGCRGGLGDGNLSALPTYTVREARVFNDSISEQALGWAEEPQSLRALTEDAEFLRRARHADLIFAGRLATIAADRSKLGVSYELTFERTEPAFKGKLSESEVTLRVGRGSPSQRYFASLDVELVGRPLIILVRYYRRDDRRAAHFRIEADTQAVRSALDSAQRAQ